MASNNGAIGTYSVSVKSFFSSWKDKSVKKAEADKKNKSKKIIKPVVNPIFEKCAELSPDPYWQGIFHDCARGKFPRGFTFKNGLINCRKGSKMTRLEISTSPTDALYEVKDFFQRMGGLLSDQDRARLKRQEDEKLIEESYSRQIETWKDVQGEKLKDILISEFITDMVKKYNLNDESKAELITNVKKGFMLKCFGSHNIEMESGRIVEIDGLTVDSETGWSEIDPDIIKVKNIRTYQGLGIEKNEEKLQIDFLDGWSKYLAGLENKRTKNTQTFSASYSTRLEDSSESYL
jgi:hypothetical protein